MRPNLKASRRPRPHTCLRRGGRSATTPPHGPTFSTQTMGRLTARSGHLHPISLPEALIMTARSNLMIASAFVILLNGCQGPATLPVVIKLPHDLGPIGHITVQIPGAEPPEHNFSINDPNTERVQDREVPLTIAGTPGKSAVLTVHAYDNANTVRGQGKGQIEIKAENSPTVEIDVSACIQKCELMHCDCQIDSTRPDEPMNGM